MVTLPLHIATAYVLALLPQDIGHVHTHTHTHRHTHTHKEKRDTRAKTDRLTNATNETRAGGGEMDHEDPGFA